MTTRGGSASVKTAGGSSSDERSQCALCPTRLAPGAARLPGDRRSATAALRDCAQLLSWPRQLQRQQPVLVRPRKAGRRARVEDQANAVVVRALAHVGDVNARRRQHMHRVPYSRWTRSSRAKTSRSISSGTAGAPSRSTGPASADRTPRWPGSWYYRTHDHRPPEPAHRPRATGAILHTTVRPRRGEGVGGEQRWSGRHRCRPLTWRTAVDDHRSTAPTRHPAPSGPGWLHKPSLRMVRRCCEIMIGVGRPWVQFRSFGRAGANNPAP